MSEPELSRYNYANLIAFTVNCASTYASVSGFYGMTNIEAAAKYPTLVTPCGFTFIIWTAIFGLEGGFAIMQLSPAIRALPLLQNGISYYYAAACLMQIAWEECFAKQQFGVSVIYMSGIVISLAGLTISLEQYPANSIAQYVILKVPFQLHAGWIFAAAGTNINMLYVQLTDDKDVHMRVAVLSVAVLTIMAIFAALRGNAVTAACIAWAFAGIAGNLANPPGELVQNFGEEVIGQAYFAMRALATVLGGSSLLAMLLFTSKRSSSTYSASAPGRRTLISNPAPLSPLPFTIEMQPEGRSSRPTVHMQPELPTSAPRRTFANNSPSFTAEKKQELAHSAGASRRTFANF